MDDSLSPSYALTALFLSTHEPPGSPSLPPPPPTPTYAAPSYPHGRRPLPLPPTATTPRKALPVPPAPAPRGPPNNELERHSSILKGKQRRLEPIHVDQAEDDDANAGEQSSRARRELLPLSSAKALEREAYAATSPTDVSLAPSYSSQDPDSGGVELYPLHSTLHAARSSSGKLPEYAHETRTDELYPVAGDSKRESSSAAGLFDVDEGDAVPSYEPSSHLPPPPARSPSLKKPARERHSCQPAPTAFSPARDRPATMGAQARRGLSVGPPAVVDSRAFYSGGIAVALARDPTFSSTPSSAARSRSPSPTRPATPLWSPPPLPSPASFAQQHPASWPHLSPAGLPSHAYHSSPTPPAFPFAYLPPGTFIPAQPQTIRGHRVAFYGPPPPAFLNPLASPQRPTSGQSHSLLPPPPVPHAGYAAFASPSRGESRSESDAVSIAPTTRFGNGNNKRRFWTTRRKGGAEDDGDAGSD